MTKRNTAPTKLPASRHVKTQKRMPPEHVVNAVDAQPASDLAAAGFPIVGIGASAGGLEAFKAFFSGMPARRDPGMAFVLVQHLAPDHKSILTDLIRRHTRMQVFQVEDGMTVQPNCVYVIPPGRDIAFLNGALQLLDPVAPRGQRLPIDFFFRTLAQDQHERAIGIVLAGTGSDGTLGLRAIKGEGGMVMAQNPASAEYDGMPRSAIATGLVDFELPPAEMPVQLIAYAAHACGRPPATATTKAENAMKKIFVLLRSQTGHDFSQYKHSTVRRRIARRMAVRHIETMAGYVKLMQVTPAETEALFRDMLIGVTHFFRDPEAFAVLEEQVIPKLFAERTAGSTLRVWTPGCSTGEEAYSLAILLQEHLEAQRQNIKLQVFASDLDSRAVAVARLGIYPAGIADDIAPERLARFFAPEPGGTDENPSAYRIHKSIRDLLVFSEHDVIKDPPFSKLDLISCRNLLIYMGAELHKLLFPLFHYALNPGGFLFLGTSESVGEHTDLFSAVDRKTKIYQRGDAIHSPQSAALGRYLPPMAGALEAPADRHAAQPDFPAKRPLRELTETASLHERWQSTNEELETTKEELQSLNQELTTVNDELQAKVSDLSRANNDMNNLLSGTGIATVFVDHQLRILRFTPTATRLIHLILADVGRPVSHIVTKLKGYDQLTQDVQAVLDTLTPKERQVQTAEGKWYTMRILPYRTLDNIVEGAVITFVDITEMVQTREALKKASELSRLAVVLTDAHDAITVQDLTGRIIAWNPGAVRAYGWSEAEALAMNVHDRIPKKLRKNALDQLKKLGQAEILEPYRTQRITKTGTIVEVSIISTALVNKAGQMYAIATTERGAASDASEPPDKPAPGASL